VLHAVNSLLLPNGIYADACREYLQPLIEGEDYPPYKNGLPDYVVMKKEMVEKKLPSFEV
jgi:6-phosphofructokinase 1